MEGIVLMGIWGEVGRDCEDVGGLKVLGELREILHPALGAAAAAAANVSDTVFIVYSVYINRSISSISSIPSISVIFFRGKSGRNES